MLYLTEVLCGTSKLYFMDIIVNNSFKALAGMGELRNAVDAALGRGPNAHSLSASEPKCTRSRQDTSQSPTESTRAEPLSIRAIKDLVISHYTVGRKSLGRLLAVGHFASWHPKKTIIRLQS
jgi:hypothetical protein